MSRTPSGWSCTTTARATAFARARPRSRPAHRAAQKLAFNRAAELFKRGDRAACPKTTRCGRRALSRTSATRSPTPAAALKPPRPTSRPRRRHASHLASYSASRPSSICAAAESRKAPKSLKRCSVRSGFASRSGIRSLRSKSPPAAGAPTRRCTTPKDRTTYRSICARRSMRAERCSVSWARRPRSRVRTSIVAICSLLSGGRQERNPARTRLGGDLCCWTRRCERRAPLRRPAAQAR